MHSDNQPLAFGLDSFLLNSVNSARSLIGREPLVASGFLDTSLDFYIEAEFLSFPGRPKGNEGFKINRRAFKEGEWLRDRKGRFLKFVGIPKPGEKKKPNWTTDENGNEVPNFQVAKVYETPSSSEVAAYGRPVMALNNQNQVVVEVGDSVNNLGHKPDPTAEEIAEMPVGMPTDLQPGETAYVRMDPKQLEVVSDPMTKSGGKATLPVAPAEAEGLGEEGDDADFATTEDDLDPDEVMPLIDEMNSTADAMESENPEGAQAVRDAATQLGAAASADTREGQDEAVAAAQESLAGAGDDPKIADLAEQTSKLVAYEEEAPKAEVPAGDEGEYQAYKASGPSPRVDQPKTQAAKKKAAKRDAEIDAHMQSAENAVNFMAAGAKQKEAAKDLVNDVKKAVQTKKDGRLDPAMAGKARQLADAIDNGQLKKTKAGTSDALREVADAIDVPTNEGDDALAMKVRKSLGQLKPLPAGQDQRGKVSNAVRGLINDPGDERRKQLRIALRDAKEGQSEDVQAMIDDLIIEAGGEQAEAGPKATLEPEAKAEIPVEEAPEVPEAPPVEEAPVPEEPPTPEVEETPEPEVQEPPTAEAPVEEEVAPEATEGEVPDVAEASDNVDAVLEDSAAADVPEVQAAVGAIDDALAPDANSQDLSDAANTVDDGAIAAAEAGDEDLALTLDDAADAIEADAETAADAEEGTPEAPPKVPLGKMKEMGPGGLNAGLEGSDQEQIDAAAAAIDAQSNGAAARYGKAVGEYNDALANDDEEAAAAAMADAQQALSDWAAAAEATGQDQAARKVRAQSRRIGTALRKAGYKPTRIDRRMQPKAVARRAKVAERKAKRATISAEKKKTKQDATMRGFAEKRGWTDVSEGGPHEVYHSPDGTWSLANPNGNWELYNIKTGDLTDIDASKAPIKQLREAMKGTPSAGAPKKAPAAPKERPPAFEANPLDPEGFGQEFNALVDGYSSDITSDGYGALLALEDTEANGDASAIREARENFATEIDRIADYLESNGMGLQSEIDGLRTLSGEIRSTPTQEKAELPDLEPPVDLEAPVTDDDPLEQLKKVLAEEIAKGNMTPPQEAVIESLVEADASPQTMLHVTTAATPADAAEAVGNDIEVKTAIDAQSKGEEFDQAAVDAFSEAHTLPDVGELDDGPPVLTQAEIDKIVADAANSTAFKALSHEEQAAAVLDLAGQLEGTWKYPESTMTAFLNPDVKHKSKANRLLNLKAESLNKAAYTFSNDDKAKYLALAGQADAMLSQFLTDNPNVKLNDYSNDQADAKAEKLTKATAIFTTPEPSPDSWFYMDDYSDEANYTGEQANLQNVLDTLKAENAQERFLTSHQAQSMVNNAIADLEKILTDLGPKSDFHREEKFERTISYLGRVANLTSDGQDIAALRDQLLDSRFKGHGLDTADASWDVDDETIENAMYGLTQFMGTGTEAGSSMIMARMALSDATKYDAGSPQRWAALMRARNALDHVHAAETTGIMNALHVRVDPNRVRKMDDPTFKLAEANIAPSRPTSRGTAWSDEEIGSVLAESAAQKQAAQGLGTGIEQKGRQAAASAFARAAKAYQDGQYGEFEAFYSMGLTRLAQAGDEEAFLRMSALRDDHWGDTEEDWAARAGQAREAITKLLGELPTSTAVSPHDPNMSKAERHRENAYANVAAAFKMQDGSLAQRTQLATALWRFNQAGDKRDMEMADALLAWDPNGDIKQPSPNSNHILDGSPGLPGDTPGDARVARAMQAIDLLRWQWSATDENLAAAANTTPEKMAKIMDALEKGGVVQSVDFTATKTRTLSDDMSWKSDAEIKEHVAEAMQNHYGKDAAAPEVAPEAAPEAQTWPTAEWDAVFEFVGWTPLSTHVGYDKENEDGSGHVVTKGDDGWYITAFDSNGDSVGEDVKIAELDDGPATVAGAADDYVQSAGIPVAAPETLESPMDEADWTEALAPHGYTPDWTDNEWSKPLPDGGELQLTKDDEGWIATKSDLDGTVVDADYVADPEASLEDVLAAADEYAGVSKSLSHMVPEGSPFMPFAEDAEWETVGTSAAKKAVGEKFYRVYQNWNGDLEVYEYDAENDMTAKASKELDPNDPVRDANAWIQEKQSTPQAPNPNQEFIDSDDWSFNDYGNGGTVAITERDGKSYWVQKNLDGNGKITEYDKDGVVTNAKDITADDGFAEIEAWIAEQQGGAAPETAEPEIEAPQVDPVVQAFDGAPGWSMNDTYYTPEKKVGDNTYRLGKTWQGDTTIAEYDENGTFVDYHMLGGTDPLGDAEKWIAERQGTAAETAIAPLPADAMDAFEQADDWKVYDFVGEKSANKEVGDKQYTVADGGDGNLNIAEWDGAEFIESKPLTSDDPMAEANAWIEGRQGGTGAPSMGDFEDSSEWTVEHLDGGYTRATTTENGKTYDVTVSPSGAASITEYDESGNKTDSAQLTDPDIYSEAVGWMEAQQKGGTTPSTAGQGMGAFAASPDWEVTDYGVYGGKLAKKTVGDSTYHVMEEPDGTWNISEYNAYGDFVNSEMLTSDNKFAEAEAWIAASNPEATSTAPTTTPAPTGGPLDQFNSDAASQAGWLPAGFMGDVFMKNTNGKNYRVTEDWSGVMTLSEVNELGQSLESTFLEGDDRFAAAEAWIAEQSKKPAPSANPTMEDAFDSTSWVVDKSPSGSLTYATKTMPDGSQFIVTQTTSGVRKIDHYTAEGMHLNTALLPSDGDAHAAAERWIAKNSMDDAAAMGDPVQTMKSYLPEGDGWLHDQTGNNQPKQEIAKFPTADGGYVRATYYENNAGEPGIILYHEDQNGVVQEAKTIFPGTAEEMTAGAKSWLEYLGETPGPPPSVAPTPTAPAAPAPVDPLKQATNIPGAGGGESVIPEEGIQFTDKQSGAHLGGFQSKDIYTDQNGKKWLAKTYGNSPKAEYRTEVEAQANNIGKLLGFNTPEATTQVFDGQHTYLQSLVPAQETDGLRGFKLEDLPMHIQQQGAAEHVLDWVISNGDGHPGNLLLSEDGQHLIGIDKGQAFKKFGSDKLARGYTSTPGSEKVWQDQVYDAIVSGQMSKEDADQIANHVLQKAHQVTSPETDGDFRDHVEEAFSKTEQLPKGFTDKDQLMTAIMERKGNALNDFEKFYKDLYEEAGLTFDLDMDAIRQGGSGLTKAAGPDKLVSNVPQPATPEEIAKWGGDVSKDGYILKPGQPVVGIGGMTGTILSISKDKTKASVLTSDGKKSTRKISALKLHPEAKIPPVVQVDPQSVEEGQYLAVPTPKQAIDKALNMPDELRDTPIGFMSSGTVGGAGFVVKKAKDENGNALVRSYSRLSPETYKSLMASLESGSGEQPGWWAPTTVSAETVKEGDLVSVSKGYNGKWRPDISGAQPTHKVVGVEPHPDYPESRRVTVESLSDGTQVTATFKAGKQIPTFSWDDTKAKPPTEGTGFVLSPEAQAAGWEVKSGRHLSNVVKGVWQPHTESKVNDPSPNIGYGSTGARTLINRASDGTVIEIIVPTAAQYEKRSTSGSVAITAPAGEGKDADASLTSALDRMGISYAPPTQEELRHEFVVGFRAFMSFDQSDFTTTKGIDANDPNDPKLNALFKEFGTAIGVPDLGWHDVYVGQDSAGRTRFYWSDRVTAAYRDKAKAKMIVKSATLKNKDTHQLAAPAEQADKIMSMITAGAAPGPIRVSEGHNPGASGQSDDANGASYGGFYSAYGTDAQAEESLPMGNQLWAANAPFVMVYDSSALLQMTTSEHRIYRTDKYGHPATGTKSYKELLNYENVMDMHIIGGLPPEDAGYYIIQDEKAYQIVIDRLRAAGKTHIGGRPIEEVILTKTQAKKVKRKTIARASRPGNSILIGQVPKTGAMPAPPVAPPVPEGVAPEGGVPGAPEGGAPGGGAPAGGGGAGGGGGGGIFAAEGVAA